MKIKSMKFTNYKNLDETEISFSPLTSYLIGENGLGKSNTLDAISKIFLYGKFYKADFSDATKKIIVHFSLHIYDDEIGIFDDFVDPKNKNQVNLFVEQDIDDNYFRLYHHSESAQEINSKILKDINLISYDSQRNPSNELTFDKAKGAGSFLNYLISSYLVKNNEEDKSFIIDEKVKSVLDYVNININRIQAVERNKITSNIDYDNANFLTKLFLLFDQNNIELKNSGYGVQFNLLIMFSLFDRIIDIVNRNKKNGEETKEIRCLLVFDEPEIHLHPFMQRTLINDITIIAEGKDRKFNELLLELFGIEKFSAQVIIVSHSDRILGSDYRNIVRFYSENSKVKTITGKNLKLSESKEEKEKLEKQLLIQFPFFSEALFAKCVIIVEGATELGALSEFALLSSLDLDKLGISIIKADGEGSILSLIKLFRMFKIPAFGIMDKDVYKEADHKSYVENGQLFFTEYNFFEEDLIEKIADFDFIEELYRDYDFGTSLESGVQSGIFNKVIKRNSVAVAPIEETLCFKEAKKNPLYLKWFFICKFLKNKGITFGKYIGKHIQVEMIPKVYTIVLNLAKDISLNA